MLESFNRRNNMSFNRLIYVELFFYKRGVNRGTEIRRSMPLFRQIRNHNVQNRCEFLCKKGTLQGTQYGNTARKVAKYRNTVSKIDEIPIPCLDPLRLLKAASIWRVYLSQACSCICVVLVDLLSLLKGASKRFSVFLRHVELGAIFQAWNCIVLNGCANF